jgi:hypothetical protein
MKDGGHHEHNNGAWTPFINAKVKISSYSVLRINLDELIKMLI